MHEAELKLSEANIVQLYSDLVDLGPEGYQSNVKYHVACVRPVTVLLAWDSEQLTAATWEEYGYLCLA